MVPPKIEVDADHLTWPCDYPRPRRRVRDPEGDFFGGFLDLASSDDLEADVLRYARQWGPLWICERHDLPSSHARPSGVGSVQVWIEGRKLGTCPPKRLSGGTRWAEPISSWRTLAEQAVALVMARADLQRDGRLSEQRHQELAALHPSPVRIQEACVDAERTPEGTFKMVPARKNIGMQQIFVTEVATSPANVVGLSMQWWLDQGAVTPTIGTRRDDYGLSLRADSLFGAIALRLAGNLANANPLVPCDYCGGLYVQTRTGTFFCGQPECDKARLRANSRRKASGKARQYQPRQPEVT